MNHFSKITLGAAAIASLAMGGTAQAATLDFNSLAHGEYVPNGSTIGGATISFALPDGSAAVGGGFDSDFTGSTSDDDLIFGGQWAGGNADTIAMGSMLYIEENPEDVLDNDTGNKGADGRDDDPDDRLGGFITIGFNRDVTDVGFDFVDIESNVSGSSKIWATQGGSAIGSGFTFADLATRDSTIEFGNRYANRVLSIRADEFLSGIGTFDGIKIKLGGSGAIDNVTFNEFNAVPEPGTLALLGSGLFAYGARRRRQA